MYQYHPTGLINKVHHFNMLKFFLYKNNNMFRASKTTINYLFELVMFPESKYISMNFMIKGVHCVRCDLSLNYVIYVCCSGFT